MCDNAINSNNAKFKSIFYTTLSANIFIYVSMHYTIQQKIYNITHYIISRLC